MIELLEKFQLTMRILYVIFVLCVAALLFTALAAARHIRRHEERRKAPKDGKFASTSEISTNSEVLVPAGKAPGD
jgi:hypothetical protein